MGWFCLTQCLPTKKGSQESSQDMVVVNAKDVITRVKTRLNCFWHCFKITFYSLASHARKHRKLHCIRRRYLYWFNLVFSFACRERIYSTTLGNVFMQPSIKIHPTPRCESTFLQCKALNSHYASSARHANLLYMSIHGRF